MLAEYVVDSLTDSAVVFAVSSRTRPGLSHVVSLDRGTGAWECSCEGYRFQGRCSHIPAAGSVVRPEGPSVGGRSSSIVPSTPDPRDTITDRAIAQSERGAPEEWMKEARRAVVRLCNDMPLFTSDDLWDQLPPPPEPRALGAVMRWAKSEGLCTATGRMLPTRRPGAHKRPIRVWRSNRTGGQATL